MTTVDTRHRPKTSQLTTGYCPPESGSGGSRSTPATPMCDQMTSCVVSIVTDEDSDDTLKDSTSGHKRSRSPSIKHVSSSASFSYATDVDPTRTAAQLLASSRNSLKQQNSRPFGGSSSGCAPILLSVPAAGPPRRRHSWICGYVTNTQKRNTLVCFSPLNIFVVVLLVSLSVCVLLVFRASRVLRNLHHALS